MDVVIAMGHFCDTHGPCVILSTDRIKEIPEKPPPALLNTPICDACRSLDLETVYDCQDDNIHYISARTNLNVHVAHLLKDAVLRSLSVEVVQEEGNDSGTMYFGDNQRGHIISHVFDIKDSLARGFKRKYCIVVLGKHQIPLLNHYDFIEQNLKKISSDLQEKANRVNLAEQSQKSQREMRQVKGSSYKLTLRSLPQLLDEPYIFGQLHMWFVFLLRSEIYTTVPHNVPKCPVKCSTAKELLTLYKELPNEIFQTILYCTLTGIKLEESGTDILKHFRQLLPSQFILPTTGKICKVHKPDDWTTNFEGVLPKTHPRLQIRIEAALSDSNMALPALPYHLESLIMRWFNISCVLSWAPSSCDNLMRALEVHKCDMPLLSYWIPQSKRCVELCEMDWFDKDKNDFGLGNHKQQENKSSNSSQA